MNLIQYISQVKAHRTRMRRWGYVYSGNHTAAVRAACEGHDAEKWAWLPWLFLFREGRGPRGVARVGYDAMNACGHALEAFKLRGFHPEEIATAKRFERIFDCLDRSIDPVARIELGDAANPPPLSDFLEGDDLAVAEEYRHLAAFVFDRGRI